MDAKAQQDAAEEALRRSLMLSLRSTGDDWYRPTLTRAKALASRMHRDVFSSTMPRDLRARIAKHVETSLKATKRDLEANREQREAQATRIARGLAAYLASAVLDSNTPGEQWEKVWRTRRDGAVRDSHRLAEGQVVDGDGWFEVGGHRMFGPGDVTAPPEEWINCRCHAEYRRRTTMPALAANAAPTGALVAAVSRITAEGSLAVSQELFEEAVRNGTAVQVGVRDDGVVLYDLLTAAADPATGFVIVGVPADDDPIWQVSSEQPPHVTLLLLSTDFLEQARQILAGEAPPRDKVTVRTLDQEELGDEGAQVVMVEPSDLADIRDALLGYEPIQQAYDALADRQHPEWIPHLTLGYPETPPLGGEVPDTITIDRLAILVDGLDSIYALGEPMADPTEPMPEQETPAEDVDEFPTSGVYEPVPIYGVLAPEGKFTGDGRGFDTDSLQWLEPPLSLRWQEQDMPGHDGSVVVGTIDRIWRENGLVKFEATSSVSDAADKHVALIAERALRGISVDLDDTRVETRSKTTGEAIDFNEMQPEDIAALDGYDLAEVVTYGRIRSAATCPIPAFPEVFVAIGTWAEHDAQQAAAEQPAEPVDEQLVASVVAEAQDALVAGITSNPTTEDGPGWLTHPIDTDRLRDYWVHGKGAAKIGWGAPGDFNRCRAFLAEYIKPMYLAGYCANRHKDALGFWPGEHRPGKHSTEVATFTLVASAPPSYAPPRSWFDDPHFLEPTPMTIVEKDERTGLRRVFGHAAQWGVCHVGFGDRCVEAPTSPSDYARFHLGSVMLDDGSMLPVGALTMDTGHADLTLSATQTMAHYDNTGTAFAYVRAGEDEHGIWFAGVILPTITDEQVFKVRGAKISGDWRNVGGQGLDAIAMLAVNTPGFPVQHAALAASAGQRQALVAAGVVQTALPDHDALERIVAAAVSERLSLLTVRKNLRDAAAGRRRAKMALIAAGRAARRGGE